MSCCADALGHVKFVSLGLGDSNYTRFMAVSRGIKRRFGELGAQDFYQHKEADEVDGIESAVEAWLEVTPNCKLCCTSGSLVSRQARPCASNNAEWGDSWTLCAGAVASTEGPGGQH